MVSAHICDRKAPSQACSRAPAYDKAKKNTHTLKKILKFNVRAITLKLKGLGSFLFVDSSVKRSNIRALQEEFAAYRNEVSLICSLRSDCLQCLSKEHSQKAEMRPQ